MPESNRVTTGIPGFDAILRGGLFDTGVYVIEGDAGTGKTIIANQICFHRAASGQRSIYYTLLAESHDRIITYVSGLEFFEPSFVPARVRYLSGFPTLETDGPPGVVRAIRDAVQVSQASLLVIDGLASIEEAAPTNNAFKKLVNELQAVAQLYRCMVLLLANTEVTRRLQAEHVIVDGIVRLEAPIIRRKPQRAIDVVKLRGADQIRGLHTLDITDAGATVYPRIEAVLARRAPAAVGGGKREKFGVPRLDDMLGGGIPAGSNTMLLGPSGSGKSVLGLQFAAAGERALVFSFYEQPGELIAKGARLGIDVEGRIERGKLELAWQSSVEASVDKIGARLMSAFDRARPTRVFIDGMHGFEVTAGPSERIQDVFAALSDYFLAEGATMMFSVETPELYGGVIKPPFPNASRMAHNILALRFAEVRGRCIKQLWVAKVRDSGFDSTWRELVIDEGGVAIGDA